MALLQRFTYKVFIFVLIASIMCGGSSAKITSQSSASMVNDNNPQPQISSVSVDQSSRDSSGLVKLMTYNIQDAGADKRWMDLVKYENPDILFLVETGFIENIDPWLHSLNTYFSNETPYQAAAFDGTGTTDGEAIFSRYPIVNSSAIYTMYLDDGTAFEINHPIMHAVVNIQGTDVHLMTNHLSCCDAFDRRVQEQEGIINFIDTLGNVPVIYGGDFNSESPQDVGAIGPFQPSLGTYPIGMMLNMSDIHGPKHIQFTDSYRALNPDRKGWTLNGAGEYFSIDHYRDRIDYIFVSQHLVDKLVNSSVVDYYPESSQASDHKPVFTWFNFKPENDFQPPLNPQNVTVDVSSTQSVLHWNSVTASDLSFYNIYRNGTLHDTVSAPVDSYTDTIDYDSSKVYKYEISAVDNVTNEGKVSLPVFADVDYGQLHVPQDVSVNITSIPNGINIKVNIGNTSNLPITQIKIYKSLKPDDVYLIDGAYTSLDLNLTLRQGFTLYYRALAVNAIGESKVSAPVKAVGGPKVETSTSSSEPPETPSPTIPTSSATTPFSEFFIPVLVVIPVIYRKKQH